MSELKGVITMFGIKNRVTQIYIRYFGFVAACVLLSACGGGGGGPSPYADTYQPSELVSSISAPDYGVTSEELVAFNLLNSERTRCGFGLLSQSPKLDLASKAHADWNLLNNQFSHNEDASVYPNGYTGYIPYDRALYQGYSSSPGGYGEVMAWRNTTHKAGVAAPLIRGLLNAPFHLALLMKGYRELGVSVQEPNDVGAQNGNAQLVADVSYKNDVGLQKIASNSVETYPCEGSTGVSYQLFGESPNPVPGRDLSTSPLGVSILIKVRDGQNLNVTSAALKETISGAAVQLRGLVGGVNGQADTIDNVFNASTAYVAADSPLRPNTQYTMNLVGTNNGVAFTKTFTFATGN